MSGTAEGNLVNTIMNEMERDNGTFNEEKQQFAGQTMTTHDHDRHHATNMREELISIIQRDPELANLINSNESNMVKINEILNNEGMLEEILKDRQLIPLIIKEILQTPDDQIQTPEINSGGTAQTPNKEYDSGEYQFQTAKQLDADGADHTNNAVYRHQSHDDEIAPVIGEFSFAEFLVGPVLAAISFFLVANTPMIYYLGQLPYLGPLLVGNKLITSLVLVMAIFIVGGFAIDVIGLI